MLHNQALQGWIVAEVRANYYRINWLFLAFTNSSTLVTEARRFGQIFLRTTNLDSFLVPTKDRLIAN